MMRGGRWIPCMTLLIGTRASYIAVQEAHGRAVNTFDLRRLASRTASIPCTLRPACTETRDRLIHASGPTSVPNGCQAGNCRRAPRGGSSRHHRRRARRRGWPNEPLVKSRRSTGSFRDEAIDGENRDPAPPTTMMFTWNRREVGSHPTPVRPARSDRVTPVRRA